jgi:hypothetical protein
MVNFVNLGEIYGRLDNARANDVNIAGARQAQEMGQYKLNQAKRADEEAMAIRDIYKSTGGDLNLTQKKLSEMGYFDQANAVGKQMTEAQTAQAGLEKDKLGNAEKKLNLVGQGMGFVLQNPTKDNALRVFDNLKGMGVLDDTQYQAYVSNLPDDPAQIKQGAETLIRMALDAKSQLPQFKAQDAGGQVINQNVNPVTGEVQEAGRIDKTQTPDSIASNQRMASEGAANRAVQMRGQNLTDARARESTASQGVGGQKAPAGYRFLPDGSLEAIPGGPQDAKKASPMNSRQLAGANMQRQATINLVAAQIGMPVDEVQKVLELEGPSGVADLMRTKGKRLFQGPIMGEIPFAGSRINADVTPYAEAIARGQAMINDPAGPITQADVEGARAMAPNPKMPLEVQANLIENLLRSSAIGTGEQQPTKQNIIPPGAAGGTVNKPTVSNW